MMNNANIDEKKNPDQKFPLEHSIFIMWKPEYNLGIPIIDEHHRGIVSIINSLHFGMQNKHSKDTLTPIVEMMKSYTRIHFQVEESFLEMTGFPNAKKHNDLHIELLSLLAQSGRNSMTDHDPSQFMALLKQWWINHICCEDLVYKNHFLTLK